MLNWQNTSWDFKDNPPEVAILPLAAFEPHGAHLPVGADLLIMDAIARTGLTWASDPVTVGGRRSRIAR